VEHTPSDTCEEYYQMGLPKPSSCLLSWCARITSSTMMVLLTNSRKVQLVLSERRSCSLVEHLGIGIHRLITLLQIHEISMLALHNACWDVLHMKGFTELGPLHLVSGASGGEIGPPCSSIT
jgi:hypothetical protein